MPLDREVTLTPGTAAEHSNIFICYFVLTLELGNKEPKTKLSSQALTLKGWRWHLPEMFYSNTVALLMLWTHKITTWIRQGNTGHTFSKARGVKPQLLWILWDKLTTFCAFIENCRPAEAVKGVLNRHKAGFSWKAKWALCNQALWNEKICMILFHTDSYLHWNKANISSKEQSILVCLTFISTN